MEITEYLRLVETPMSRTNHYAKMVEAYYELATPYYRDLWADSFHLTWFADRQTLGEAQLAQEHWLADKAGFGAGARLLDVGCGIGGPAAAIAEHTGAHVTGVNISGVQVEMARSRPLRRDLRNLLEFVQADAMELPFGPAEFDGAFSIEALCHTPDKGRAYAQIARVLKDGAVFVGTDWFSADGISAPDYARWIEPACQALALPHLISLDELRTSLEAVGFEVESVSRYGDHGAVEPNWRLFDPIEDKLGESAEHMFLKGALDTLRNGYDSDNFVLGCWLAHKRS